MADVGRSDENGNAAPTVFISYSRDDRKHALQIIDILERNGFSVWWDGMLEGGDRFSHTTAEALENAKAVVVLWSKTSAESHWVHDEATQGRDRKRLVPLSIDGSDPPLGFRQFQVIDATPKKVKANSAEMTGMLRAVAALHNRPFVAPEKDAVKNAIVSRRAAVGGGLALLAAGGSFVLYKSGLFGGGAVGNSVAVLPFANLSRDPAQQYFSDGLASEIRAQLSRNALLEVVGQTSSNQFRDKTGDARSIAKELRVSYILGGNVQKMGDRLKIVTDLTDGKTGISKWAQTFERQMADIFAVQSEIATAVAGALSAAMDRKASGDNALQVGGTKSLAAFDAYLRGRDLFESHIDENSERAALAKFEQAIAIDPEYAAARASRARSLAVIANQYANAVERRSLYGEAVDEARRATNIAPDFALGFAALGYALFYGRLDAKAAKVPYERAHELAQSDVDVLGRYAVFCARTGRFSDADAAINRAAALDPLNPSMFKSAGNIKYAAKSYQEAIDFARQALALNPKRSTLHGDIGNAYLMLGDLAKAGEEFAQETNTLLALPGKAIVAHRQGDKTAAQKALEALVEEHGDNALYQQAQILAQWGDAEQAFAALDRAYATADSGLVYLLNDPLLDPVRNDGRYKKLLMELKFV